MGIEVRSISLPPFPLPEGFVSEAEYLRHLALKGLRRHFVCHDAPPVDALTRLDEELQVLCKGFPEYMLIVNDYVHWARDNGLQVNADRGAVCGSLVAWALGITEDARSPMDRGLHFESFVNPMFAEHWLPDIDLWVSDEAVPRIHGYVMGKYGKEHFARIRNYPRGFILCGDKVSDRVPIDLDEHGVQTTACPVREALEANLCKFDLDVDDRHPIEIECLRETNGLLVYHEQIANMIHIMANTSYALSLWTEKQLAVKRFEETLRYGRIFVENCLANPMFRQGRWRDEDTARTYTETLWENWGKSASRLFMQTHAMSGYRAFSIPTTRASVGEVTMQDVGVALKRGERVAILVRHAERPPLEKNDPTFGKNLHLTERGREEAETFGYVLAQFCVSASVHVSACDTARCIETARIIDHQIDGDGVNIAKLLGDESPYFGDVAERLKLADAGDYLASLNTYFQKGEQKGFRPLSTATDELEGFLWSRRGRSEGERLQVFVTHDINVGCFLAGRKVVAHFEDNNWPKYLDAAVVFLGKYGHARYGYLRSPASKFTIDHRVWMPYRNW